MSDTSTTTPAAPSVADTVTAQQAGIAPPATGNVIDQARWDREVANHVRERNLWKPAQQILGELDDDARAALLELADAVRRGDREAVLEWSEQTLATAGGKSAAEVIAERQARRNNPGQAPAVQAPPAPAGLTPDQVAAEVQKQLTMERNRDTVNGLMSSAGYNPGTAEYDVIIRHCVINNIGPEQGVAWYNQALQQRMNPAAVAAAATAGMQLPGTAPFGAPANTSPTENMTSRERAIARLKGAGGS